MGKHVLLVDLDRQGNATTGVGFEFGDVPKSVNDLFANAELYCPHPTMSPPGPAQDGARGAATSPPPRRSARSGRQSVAPELQGTSQMMDMAGS